MGPRYERNVRRPLMSCHVLLALPVLGLVLFFVLPLPFAVPLYGVVLIASGLTYRVLLQAARLPVKTGTEGMAGGLAYVVEPLQPEGVIRYGGELWRAAGAEWLEKGARVRIERVEGMTVIVRADAAGGKAAEPCR